MPAVTFGFAPSPVGITCGIVSGAQALTLSTGSTVFGLLSYSMSSNTSAISLSINGVTALIVNSSGTANDSVADTIPIPSGATIIMTSTAGSVGGLYLTVYPK